jgi:putative SOS response-associated peptidase YedK
MADDSPLSMAGIWDRWEPKDGSEPVESCTIITTEPNELMEPIHDRMPVILSPDQFDDWLDVDGTLPATAQAMLRPFPSELMRAYNVGTEVNKAANEGPELIEPLRTLI